MPDRLTVSTELQELKKALAESPPGPDHARVQDIQDVHPAGGLTQQDSSIVYGGTHQGCSCGQ
jgi:hypothetical protein